MRLRRLSKEEQAVKAKEMQNMSSEELTKKLGDLKEELFNLRFQHAINQLEDVYKRQESRPIFSVLFAELNL